MPNWKKVGIVAGGVVVAGGIAAGVWAYQTFDTSRSAGVDDRVAMADFTPESQEAVKRGEYVMRLGDCAACHNKDFSGGYKIETPFGDLLSSNITPDRDTGLGKMTEREFYNAIRQGIGSHGLLYPAMPFTAYSKLNDQDVHDLWAYMSTVKPVSNDVDETAGMSFPFNIRLAMAGWDMLFFDNKGFQPAPDKEDAWNRGKYIVDGPAHCSACHSPRNLLGAESSGAYLHGGQLGTWYAPDITSNPHTGIGDWSIDQLAEYLKTGSDGTAVAAGPMAEAVEHSTQYFTDDDLNAIGTYLKSVPASEGQAPEPMSLSDQEQASGALSYEVNCSACHGTKGEGMKGMVPAFAGNRGILADNPTNLIHAMLVGARAPHTEIRQTAAGMPSFAWKMDDQQIANVLNHIRNSWGNGAGPVTADQVGKLRDQLDARHKLETPMSRADTADSSR